MNNDPSTCKESSQKPSNNSALWLAISSLVFGIAGIPLVLLHAGLPFGAGAVILGVLALSAISREPNKSKLIASSGAYAGVIALSLSIFSYVSTGACIHSKCGLASPQIHGNSKFIIPDLKGWNKIAVGMTQDDVIKLIGEPQKRQNPPDGKWATNELYPWSYGYAYKASDDLSSAYNFIIFFKMGKVYGKEEPFGDAKISLDGTPSVPVLMLPKDNQVFDHYPRFVDFHWYPSSGDYPMEYEVEAGIYSNGVWSISFTDRMSAPCFHYSHSGMNKGRWRVRAVNNKGTSEWTDYRFFEFTR